MAPTNGQSDERDRRAILQAEMDAIHHANRVYWEQPAETRTAEDIAAYHRRLERLEEIRRELADMEY
jgi:hypothetical protein